MYLLRSPQEHFYCELYNSLLFVSFTSAEFGDGEIFHLQSTVELNQSKIRCKHEESGPVQRVSLNLFNVHSSVKTEQFALRFPKATFPDILHGLVYIHNKETATLHHSTEHLRTLCYYVKLIFHKYNDTLHFPFMHIKTLLSIKQKGFMYSMLQQAGYWCLHPRVVHKKPSTV